MKKRAFFFLGLGFFFLFDAETYLRAGQGSAPYAVLDLFPDVLAWLLMAAGLWILCREHPHFKPLRFAASVHFFLSVFTLLTETAFFSVFYRMEGEYPEKILFLEIFEYALRVTEFIFCLHLFGQVRLFCGEKEDEKLVRACRLEEGFILTHFILFAAAIVLKYLPLPAAVPAVADRLQYLFWILVIWFGGITLIRCDLRLSR